MIFQEGGGGRGARSTLQSHDNAIPSGWGLGAQPLSGVPGCVIFFGGTDWG